MDLFNNPMVTKALEAMTPEQREEYRRIGEEMYGTVHFEDSKILNNMPPPMAEALAYVEVGLKSGLAPADMEPDEIALMENAHGKEWYTKYGWTEEDLPKPDSASVTQPKVELVHSQQK